MNEEFFQKINRNYKRDLDIDMNDLEGEWLKQPSLFMYYSQEHSEAIKERENAKNNLDVIDAQLDSEIRRDWEKHWTKSPTETAVKNWVLQHEKHKKALDVFNEKSHSVNLLQSAKSAFDHRRKALENLVTLLVTGFHSEPKVSKHITKGEHLGLDKTKKVIRRNRS